MARSFFVHSVDKLPVPVIGKIPEISVGFFIVAGKIRTSVIKLRDVVGLGITSNLPGAVGLSVSKMGFSPFL